MSSLRRYWDTAFAVDMLAFAFAAPLLYAPSYFGNWGVPCAFAVLALAWVWRRVRLGIWYQRTPADWPALLLIGVILPVSVWAAPVALRMEYSWPKTLVLIWNFQLFVAISTHVSRRRTLLVPALMIFLGTGFLFALIAPLGTNWLLKLPGMALFLGRMPRLLGALSREGEIGFHPNIVAGALLYVLPLMIAITISGLRRGRHRVLFWSIAAATLYMLVIFALLQSRGGYIGLAVSLIAMPLLHHRYGRRLLLLTTLLLLVEIFHSGGALLDVAADNPSVEAVGGLTSLENFRLSIWSIALLAIRDFPFTGSGLGAFQSVVTLLYPHNIPQDYYFGHAHNFWIQTAVDFGIPGLIAVIAIYFVAVAQVASIWESDWIVPGVVTGLAGCLIAQSTFSLTDAIPMGATPNLLLWMMFGLIFAMGNISEENP